MLKKYDKDSDILYWFIKPGKEDHYEEILPGIVVEFNKKGDVIGIEVMDYKKKLKKV